MCKSVLRNLGMLSLDLVVLTVYLTDFVLYASLYFLDEDACRDNICTQIVGGNHIFFLVEGKLAIAL